LIWINPVAYSPPRDLGQYAHAATAQICPMWQTVANAPFGCDLELAVVDHDGTHALAFACRRIPGGWTNSDTKLRLDVRPTHWRPWGEQSESRCQQALVERRTFN
jgi:hypothetical protein